MTTTNEERGAQFERAVWRMRQSLHREFRDPEVQTRLIEALDAARERVRARALQEASVYTPRREFRRLADAALAEAMAPALDAAREARREKEVQALKGELELLAEFDARLELLSLEVERGMIPGRHARESWSRRRVRNGEPLVPWRGADVILSEAPLPDYRGGSVLVVTPHAAALRVLFDRVRDADPGVLDYRSRYEFYGEIAEALSVCLQQDADAEEKALLRGALVAARGVVAEWRSRVQGHPLLHGRDQASMLSS